MKQEESSPPVGDFQGSQLAATAVEPPEIARGSGGIGTPDAAMQSRKKGRARSEEIVEGVGRPAVSVRNGGASGRKNTGDMCAGDAGDAGNQFLAARPFAGRDQREREQRAKGDSRAGAEPHLLDRQAQHEKAAAGNCDTASPNDPLRAKALFKT